jgi:tetratricopeptide (TPR) repeat protein
MLLPDLAMFRLHDQTLVEISTPERLVLWQTIPGDSLPGRWIRIAVGRNLEGSFHGTGLPAELVVAHGSSLELAQRTASLWERVRGRRAGENSPTALETPRGTLAEPVESSRREIALVWNGHAGGTVEMSDLDAAWPDHSGYVELGANLVAVVGIGPSPPTATSPQQVAGNHQVESADQAVGLGGTSAAGELLRPENDPRVQARSALEAARQAADAVGEQRALADLGAAQIRGGEPQQGIQTLGDALAMCRARNDRPAERDIRGSLGSGYLELGEWEQAVAHLAASLEGAVEAQDGFAEKMMRSQLGTTYLRMGDLASATQQYEAARRLAVELQDEHDEADIAWRLAIALEQQGDRRQADRYAQRAVNLMQHLQLPSAAVFANHLESFRRESTALATAPPRGPSPGASGQDAATISSSGPGWLRMAYTATRSFGRFALSGMQTVDPEQRTGRLAECAACEHHTGIRCRLCGCFTAQKTWLPHERCPIDRWE